VSPPRRPSLSRALDTAALVVLVLLVAALVFSGTVAGTSTKVPEPWTPSAQDDLTGEQLYGFACASCHGADLQGGEGPRLGAGSDTVDLTDAEIAEIVFLGEDDMQPLQGSLTPKQVQAITDYLRSEQTR